MVDHEPSSTAECRRRCGPGGPQRGLRFRECDDAERGPDSRVRDLRIAAHRADQHSGGLRHRVRYPDLRHSDSSTGNPLQGTTWELVSTTTGTGEPEMVDPEIGATLTLTGTQLQVSTGCNSGSGSITVMGDGFHVDPLATTRMACDPERTKLEAIQLAVLTDQVGYQIAGDQLTLSNGAGSLVYQAAPAGSAESSDAEPASATPMPTAGASESLIRPSIPEKSSIQVSIPEKPNSTTN